MLFRYLLSLRQNSEMIYWLAYFKRDIRIEYRAALEQNFKLTYISNSDLFD